MKFANVLIGNGTVEFQFRRNDENLRYAVVSLDNFPTVRDADYYDAMNYKISRYGDTVYWPTLGFDIDANIVAEACSR